MKKVAFILACLALMLVVHTAAAADNPTGPSEAQYFIASSDTATSTFAGPLAQSAGVTQFTLSQRSHITNIPVPTFRPTTPNTTIAEDILPNGTPKDGGFGFAWTDICDTDVMYTGDLPIDCLHLSANANAMTVGSVSYKGAAPKPLVFSVGSDRSGTEYARVDTTGNFGVGTTSPFAKLSVSSASTPLFALGTASGKTLELVDGSGNEYAGGDLPTLTACGKAPQLSTGSNNNVGRITVGAASGKSCSMQFASGGWKATANAPVCMANSEGSATPISTTPTKTGVTFTAATGLANETITYECKGF